MALANSGQLTANIGQLTANIGQLTANIGQLTVNSGQQKKRLWAYPNGQRQKTKRIATYPDVNFSNVGGRETLIKYFQDCYGSLGFRELWQKMKEDRMKTYFFRGPKGCGKTLLAHSIAGEYKLPLLSLAAIELVEALSEDPDTQIIQDLFDQAAYFQDCYGSLGFRELWQKMKEDRMKTYFFRGPKGCGKTLLAHSIAGEYKLPLLSLAAIELVEALSEDPDTQIIQDLFDQAAELAPCVLLIDNIELIATKRNTTKAMENTIFSQITNGIKDLRSKESAVVLICATNRPDLLDRVFVIQCFNCNYPVIFPHHSARRSILEALCKKVQLADDASMCDIAYLTNGYVGSDLKSLMSLTITCALHRVMSEHELQRESAMSHCDSTDQEERSQRDILYEDRLTLTMSDFQKALAQVKPTSKQEDGIFISNTTWKDIGGINLIRRAMDLHLMRKFTRPDLYPHIAIGISVLLVGPSGVGKTSMGMAAANGLNRNFLYVKGAELSSTIVGQSEENVHELFRRARCLIPCLIFIDEIDSICHKMSESDEAFLNPATTQLLTELVLLTPGTIFVLAATNSLDKVDPELLLPGRIDKIVDVGLPSAEARVEILRVLTKNGTRPKLAADVDLGCIGKDSRCEGLTGAALKNLVEKAHEACLRQIFESTDESLPYEMPVVNKSHFESAFESIQRTGQEQL